MAEIADAFNTWQRNYVTDGVPASGINPPSKAEGRSIGALIEAYVAGAVTAISAEGGATEIIRDVTADTGSVTSGAAKHTFRLPHAMLISEVRASLTAASSSGDVTVDINAGGVSILSTVIHVDEGTKTSVGSATPFALSTTDLADDTEITIDVDGAGASATGLKVSIIGVRTNFGAPTTPYFFGAGAIVSGDISDSGALPVSFPAGVAAGDIAFLQVLNVVAASDGALDWVRPSGWTLLGTNTTVAGTPSHCAAIYWRRCDGSETTVSISTNGVEAANFACGQVSVWRGCVALGDPFVALGQDNDTGLAMNGSTIVATLNSSLAVNFYAAHANATAPADTGWTSAFFSTASPVSVFQLLTASTHPAALAGTIAAESRVLSTGAYGDTWFSYSLALIPGS